MTPTPSRDEMLALQEWIREPDFAEEFSLADMADWMNRRPLSVVLRLAVSASGGVQKEAPLAKPESPGADRSVSEILNETGLRFAAIALCKRADGDDSRFKHMEPVYMDEARTSVTAYLKAIANSDGQQCNEQSGKELSRADVCDAGIPQTWDECPECGASLNDLCGKVFRPIDLAADSQEVAETQRTDNAESTPPAVFSDPTTQPPESGAR